MVAQKGEEQDKGESCEGEKDGAEISRFVFVGCAGEV